LAFLSRICAIRKSSARRRRRGRERDDHAMAVWGVQPTAPASATRGMSFACLQNSAAVNVWMC
jgi:hypothetical protein